MKTILYATDYSDNSVAAFKYAFQMSTQLDMRLVITHVFDNPQPSDTEGFIDPSLYLGESASKMHRSKLEEFCEAHLGGDWNTTKIQLHAVENRSIVKGIISVAEEWHAQMIVVGMKGESALKELLMGSVAKHLIEKAPCPILAIPEDAQHMPIKTIVYATDFEEEDIFAIRKLAEMAEKLEAEIKIVHISTKEEYDGETQMEWFKEMLQSKVTYERMDFELLFSEDVFESLRLYLGKVNADLMVMLEREGQGFLRKWFHGNLVKKMESYGRVPLLSFKEGNHQLFFFSAVL